jgi:DNA polymerase III delta prime subunit
MAKVYPEKYVGKEGAEKRLFEKLRGLNSTQWTFFHSVDIAWHSEKRSGEIDFIAVSRTALFTLEVKGGRISRNAGAWYANGQEMEESPVKQAIQNYHAFDKYLKRSKLPRLPGGHCCVWPDVAFETTTGEWEKTCIIDKGGIEMLFDSLQKAENHFRDEATRLGRSTPTLSEEEYNRLCGAILPDVIEHVSTSQALARDKVELLHLSQSQLGVLDRIEGNPRMVISGPAGSGKTILAYEACKRILRENPQWKGAFVCQSIYLAKDIDRRYQEDKLHERLLILTLESLAPFYFINGLGIDMQAAGESKQPIELRFVRHGHAPNQTAGINSKNLLDFVVIDEGQDIRKCPIFLTMLNSCIKNGLSDCRLMWFQDLDQSIAEKLAPSSHKKMYSDIIDPDPLANCFHYKLDPINYRNPTEIANVSAKLIGLKTKSSFNGNLATCIRLVESQEPLSALSNLIKTLTEEGVPDSDIVVVSVTGESSKRIEQGLRVWGKLLAYDTEEYDRLVPRIHPKDTILWSRLIDIKGREFPVVILIDLPDFKDAFDKYLMYVAMTRANSLLIAVGSESQLRPLT